MSREVRDGAATRRRRCEMSGFTVLPRWSLGEVAGVGAHEVRIPDELAAASRRLASDAAVPLSSVLLAAHAKVLGALCGEQEVSTGYAVDTRAPLPIRMTLGPRSWREVLREIARAESDLPAHAPVPLDALRHRTGPGDPSIETVFELSACGAELTEGVALRVTFLQRDPLV